MTVSALRLAIDAGDFQTARRLAAEAPRVSLRDALRLTLLAAQAEPELYGPMARRWMLRLMREREPRFRDLELAADVFSSVRDRSTAPQEAARALERIAGLA